MYLAEDPKGLRLWMHVGKSKSCLNPKGLEGGVCRMSEILVTSFKN